MFPLFATGINNTSSNGGKFTAGVVDHQCKNEGVSLSTTNSVDSQQDGHEDVALFTANSVDVRVYPCLQSTVWRLWTWGCFRFHLQHCGRAGCILLHLYTMLLMPECRTVEHRLVRYRNKKMPMPEAVRYRNKGTQSCIGMLRYRTEMLGAVILMPAAVVSMPMPSYSYGNTVSAQYSTGNLTGVYFHDRHCALHRKQVHLTHNESCSINNRISNARRTKKNLLILNFFINNAEKSLHIAYWRRVLSSSTILLVVSPFPIVPASRSFRLSGRSASLVVPAF